MVSISLQEAAKGLQEVEEIPDFFRRADGKMGKRLGCGQKLGARAIKMEYSINIAARWCLKLLVRLK